MQRALHKLIVALAATGLMACGGSDVESIECGEGAVEDEESGECIAAHYQDECADGEVRDEALGTCVTAGGEYCAEDTEFDDEAGQCVGEQFECGDDAIDEDGECIPDGEVACGEGTVVDGNQCVPYDDVCGDDNEYHGDQCRPVEDICGEGTTFEVSERRCVPTSTLECGPGTIEEDSLCIPVQAFYDDLAQDPDLDLVDDGDGNFDLAEAGDKVSFVGNIDGPEYDDDGEPVQYQDVLEFDADAGQWLEITVYSMGLPEPVFEFSDIDGESFRRSDLGAGIEVSREVLVPDDGTWELSISNMPQFLDEAPPAGGDDWGYVGYVETMDAPEASSFDLLEDTISGDIRHLSDNFYAVDADDVGSVAMIFSEIPSDADAQLQVWADETTRDSTIELGDDSFAFEPPDDSFFVAFDRQYAYGPDVEYGVSAQTGSAASAGDSISEEFDIDAGDYVGLFQYNLQGLALTASISDGDQYLASTDELEVSNAEEGQLGLYWRAESETTVTLELDNTTGEDLDFLSFEPISGTTDILDNVDSSGVQTTYDQTLPRGHRHMYELDVTYTGDLSFRTEDTGGTDTFLTLTDADGNVITDGRNAAIFEAEPGTYFLEVEALGTVSDGFTLSGEQTQLYTESTTSTSDLAIPDNDPEGVTDSLSISSCPYIEDIEVIVNISHPWRNDLVVEVTSPTGDTAMLHDRDGGSDEDINATYPDPDDSGLADGSELLDMIGSNGSGSWEIHVSDNELQQEGTLDSWTVILSCEG